MRRALLAACAALLPAAAMAETTMRIGLREDADILDPTLARSYVGRIVFAGLCDKLFDINEKLEIVPQLATGYEWADPKTLVIHLRDGVQFQDGTRMDAAAVKYSLDRHLTLQGSFRRSEIGAIDRVEVADPLTVRLVLKMPNSPLVAQLADRAGMIVSPKAAEAEGKEFGTHPVCAGPFRFVERVAQDRIVLERFPDYWDAKNIHLDRVVYQPIVDSSVRLANLRAGSLDLSEYIVPTDMDAVKSDPKLRLVLSDALGYQGITMNAANGSRAKGPVGDPRVRQAFALSIDREALVGVVDNGVFPPTAQAIPPESPFHLPDVKPPARDVARAKALLKETGLPTPVAIELMTPNDPEHRQMAEVIQSMAAEAGFDVKIRATEFASSLDAAERGDFDAYLLQWSGRVDPDGNLWSFLHAGGALNYGHYGNNEVDAALDEARTVTDVAQRRAIYDRMWPRVAAEVPIAYVWSLRNIVGMSARVQGFRPIPDGLIRLQGVSLKP